MYLTTNKKNYSLFSGILLLVLGIVIFNNPFGTLEFLLTIVAIGILIWGITNIISYKLVSVLQKNQSWILLQGILNILFAIVILMSLNLAVRTIMIIFGIYLISLSVIKVIHAVKLVQYNIVGWELSLTIGIIGILFGICLFILPEIIPVILSLLLMTIGIIIIVNAIIKK